MRRHKNILVAVDGSEASLNALSESIQLARWTRGGITAITVVPSYEGDLSLVGVKDIKAAILGPCESILGKAVEVAESFDFQITIVCEEGEPGERIVECAESRGIDLIVMGQGNDFSLFRLLLGSTISDVVKRTRSDVLVVPEGVTMGWERILLVADGLDLNGAVCRRAIEVAASYGGTMKALGVVDNASSSKWLKRASGEAPHSMQQMTRYLEDIEANCGQDGLKVESLVRRGRPCTVIGRVTRDHGIDAIFLGPAGRTGLKGMLTGRSPEMIVRESSRPVLILQGR